MIDTHAHVYQHVTGRFGLDADTGGRALRRHHRGRSGRAELHDAGGVPPFHRRTGRDAACCASSPPIWSAGWRGICIRNCMDPARSTCGRRCGRRATMPTWCAASRAHAEIGGVSRWGLEVIKLAKQIAHEAGLPLYIHLGQLWPVQDGAEVDADEVVRALVPLMEPGDVLAHPFTRHPGGFISERDRRGASGGLGGAGARRDGGCRPRLAFQLRHGAQGDRGGDPADDARRRHARLQRARARRGGRGGARPKIRSSAWHRST